jgi:cysteine desulfurase
MVYLDNSATTRPLPEVVEVMGKIMEKHYGNPSSLHRLGVEADKLLTQARDLAARMLRIESSEVIFTSGGTESNNLAIKGIAFQYEDRGRHLITTEIEHASVYSVFKQLEQAGFQVTYLPVDSSGRVSVSDVEEAIQDETTLVSVMMVNNESGTIQPVEQIGHMLRKHPKILFHVDAVQAFGKVPFHIKDWGIDLLTLSAHKFHGPKGIGLLYKRQAVKLSPLFVGGDQENGLRPGTENVQGIIGMVKAMRIIKERMNADIVHMKKLKDRLIHELTGIDRVMINTPHQDSAPHIVNVSVPSVKAEALLHTLEQKGFYVSTRSACSSKKVEPSRVLKAMGRNDKAALGSIRISLEASVTEDQIGQFLQAFKQSVQQLIELKV